MNERFYALPQERQHAMLNAGFSVFARTGFKKGSMDDVARAAGVSKALLFHYFGSKRNFYLYLYRYALDYLAEHLASRMYCDDEDDFFALIERGQALKFEILGEHPDLMQFLIAGYFEPSDEVSPEIRDRLFDLIAQSGKRFAERVDASKFADGITVEQATDIVMLFSDGFMRQQTPDKLADLDALNREYLAYLDVLRRRFYRKDCL